MQLLPATSKNARVPWLVIVALAGTCGLMAFTAMSQARTIDAQRTLIHELLQDSLRLNALRMQQPQPVRRGQQ